MARPKKQPGLGHNLELTEDERSALKIHYAQQVIAAQRIADASALTAKNDRKAVNSIFTTARGHLQINRDKFEEDIKLWQLSPAELAVHEADRNQRLREMGLKPGEQRELPLGDTADDKAMAYAAGEQAGFRGDTGDCPDTIAPVCRGDWEHGWADGQAKLAEKLFQAKGILERIQATRVELEADEPEEEELDQIDIEDGLDDAARKLKRSGWTEPTAEEAALEKAA